MSERGRETRELACLDKERDPRSDRETNQRVSGERHGLVWLDKLPPSKETYTQIKNKTKQTLKRWQRPKFHSAADNAAEADIMP